MRTTLIAITTAALAAGSVLAAAPAQARRDDPVLISPAEPNQVWFQSFQRASEDAPCVAPAELDIPWQDDWPAAENAWTASWSQWANDGAGGWTCDRHITWANGSPAVYGYPLY